MDDYKTLVEDATRAVVKEGLGGAVWVHRLADAVGALVAERDYANACLKASSHNEVEYGAQLDRVCRERDALQQQLAADNFESARSRIAALEAVIAAVREHATRDANVGQPCPHDGFEEGLDHGAAIHAEATLRVLDLAPSVVLDGMIREAKAEAEAERDALRAQLEEAKEFARYDDDSIWHLRRLLKVTD